MKKLSIMLIVLSLSLIACQTETKTVVKNSNNVKVETSSVSESNNKPEKDIEHENNIIATGQTYTSNLMELSIKPGYDFKDEIHAENEKDFSLYYTNEAPDDSDYIVLKGVFKNIGTDTVNLQDYAYRAVINGKYNYSLQPTYENNGQLEINPYVKPLETREIIIFGSIPNEGIESIESIKLQFGYNDDSNNMYNSLESREHIINFELVK